MNDKTIGIGSLPFWSSFRLPDGKRRWFFTDGVQINIENKEWFNKATDAISILKGYETEEYSKVPVSELMYRISIEYQIANYFGDRSGMHYRRKEYVLIGDKLYKQVKGEGTEVKKITKELKGILEEIGKLS